MMMSCCVRQGGDDNHGRHFDNKTRLELMIHYDENSMRARKCLQRGMLQTHESLTALGEQWRGLCAGEDAGSLLGHKPWIIHWSN